ncbi:uncharacterized protein VNE69_01158 [Vairimorpha necatrix]|uniref:Uncharacterized protein n=1 Tax=Vairimorpha necatrix TaxID=6039 RepID=A0AAX4J8B5_9MICR
MNISNQSDVEILLKSPTKISNLRKVGEFISTLTSVEKQKNFLKTISSKVPVLKIKTSNMFDEFTDDFISSIKNKKLDDFMFKYNKNKKIIPCAQAKNISYKKLSYNEAIVYVNPETVNVYLEKESYIIKYESIKEAYYKDGKYNLILYSSFSFKFETESSDKNFIDKLNKKIYRKLQVQKNNLTSENNKFNLVAPTPDKTKVDISEEINNKKGDMSDEEINYQLKVYNKDENKSKPIKKQGKEKHVAKKESNTLKKNVQNNESMNKLEILNEKTNKLDLLNENTIKDGKYTAMSELEFHNKTEDTPINEQNTLNSEQNINTDERASIASNVKDFEQASINEEITTDWSFLEPHNKKEKFKKSAHEVETSKTEPDLVKYSLCHKLLDFKDSNNTEFISENLTIQMSTNYGSRRIFESSENEKQSFSSYSSEKDFNIVNPPVLRNINNEEINKILRRHTKCVVKKFCLCSKQIHKKNKFRLERLYKLVNFYISKYDSIINFINNKYDDQL